MKRERCFGGDDAGRESSRLVRVFGLVVGDGREIAEVARGEQPRALGWIASLEQTKGCRERGGCAVAVAEGELRGAFQQPDVGNLRVGLDGGVGAADCLVVVAAVEGDQSEECFAEQVAVAAEVERALSVSDRGCRVAAARVGESHG